MWPGWKRLAWDSAERRRRRWRSLTDRRRRRRGHRAELLGQLLRRVGERLRVPAAHLLAQSRQQGRLQRGDLAGDLAGRGSASCAVARRALCRHVKDHLESNGRQDGGIALFAGR